METTQDKNPALKAAQDEARELRARVAVAAAELEELDFQPHRGISAHSRTMAEIWAETRA